MKMLVVTDLSFPNGSAMSSRIKSFSKLFKEIGYEIHIIAGKTEGINTKYNTLYRDDDYSYEIVRSKRSEQIQSFIGNENLVRRVNDYLDANNVDLVFFNSLGALFNKILDACKKHNVKTLLEQCEWYDPSGFRFNKYDLRYIRFCKNIANNFIKVDGVISISRLLDDYYLSHNVKSIRIPSLFDVNSIKHNDSLYNKNVKLIYTGNVGKSKELLEPIIATLANDKYQNEITLDIYGINKDDVLKNIDNKVSLLKSNVVIHGRVSYVELQDALLNANYQIFFKPIRKSSDAQFPTKLAESMSYGTPVICNNTGDISLYLKNGQNGFLCEKNNLEKIFDTILPLSNEEYNKLRVNARKTAINCFDYSVYKKELKRFIESI